MSKSKKNGAKDWIAAAIDMSEIHGIPIENELTETVGLKMNSKMFNHLKDVARKESFLQNEDITISGLIRKAILRTFPYPLRGLIGKKETMEKELEIFQDAIQKKYSID